MQMLDDFEALGVKSKAQAQEMMDAEALLGDIPDEFLDPIQVELLLNCQAIYFILCSAIMCLWTCMSFISS